MLPMGEVPQPLVADTHVLIWYLQDLPLLSDKAVKALDAVAAAGDPIFVSAATPVELRYLLEKGKVTETDYRRYLTVLESLGGYIEVVPVDMGVVRAMELVPREQVPDPWDRLIAATALAIGVPLVTRDRKLRTLPAVDTIW